MAKLPFDDLYLPDTDEPWGVLTWGKSPELVEKDLADGVARIGGFRSPDYGQSDLLAAKTLLRTARESKTLDHHGLPIFFLQRHAAELIIKAPLQLGLQIQKYRERLKRPRPNFPMDDEQRKRAEDSHDLGKLLNDLERVEKMKASIRAKVEHPFRVIKQQFGFTKVRYRDLMKNTAQIVTLFALSNLWMARKRLIQAGG